MERLRERAISDLEGCDSWHMDAYFAAFGLTSKIQNYLCKSPQLSKQLGRQMTIRFFRRTEEEMDAVELKRKKMTWDELNWEEDTDSEAHQIQAIRTQSGNTDKLFL
ncbi:hypothetical protein DACRYDRAFT_118709 [Dacryopinax primogenitus]|uniref:Uncharacterized protein n=1 Tax=Dacryopinax primogenitus (strain DJM 731) TaxID=1858805 RepID=M5G3T8_DACPD|nr:uncharacterized protein DACRYDRAFT_118709 [Dacryopinax primogenitus]EJT98427.1 hypothetical protein DACRYDRAFT_118709 [Dacryopinax primogenitus]